MTICRKQQQFGGISHPLHQQLLFVYLQHFFYFTANCGHSELTRLKTITLFPFWLHWFCVLLAGKLLRHLGNKHVVVVLVNMIYFLLSLSAPRAGVCV